MKLKYSLILVSIFIFFLSLPLIFSASVSAAPRNNPIFATMEWVHEQIAVAVEELDSRIAILTGKVEVNETNIQLNQSDLESLRQRADNLEERVEHLGSLLTPTPAIEPSIVFEENFDGSELDLNIWEFFSTDGGNYSLEDGKIVVSGGTSMFYVSTKNNPFPSGQFELEFAIQYTSVDESGNGVAMGYHLQNGYDPDNVPLAYWQGSNLGLQIVRFGLTQAVIGDNPDLDYHVVKIVFDGEGYDLYLDGEYKHNIDDSNPATSLWFGNPFCCRNNWTGFKLDYIKITDL